MAHALRSGTAWDRRKEDYAYVRELDSTGWAWEFLRRNENYRRDFRMNRAGHPVAIQHVSGATLYRPRRRFLAAEEWGLELFADPGRTALETDVFWMPEHLRNSVSCCSKAVTKPCSGLISLDEFRGRRAVLAGLAHEHVSVSGARDSASMFIENGTMLFGKCAVTFSHDGLSTVLRHAETLAILRRFASKSANRNRNNELPDSKYLDALIALDGHLEGRNFRDIALVLFGQDRVRAHWSGDTQWMKSRIRRASKIGKLLMNGEYRALL